MDFMMGSRCPPRSKAFNYLHARWMVTPSKFVGRGCRNRGRERIRSFFRAMVIIGVLVVGTSCIIVECRLVVCRDAGGIESQMERRLFQTSASPRIRMGGVNGDCQMIKSSVQTSGKRPAPQISHAHVEDLLFLFPCL